MKRLFIKVECLILAIASFIMMGACAKKDDEAIDISSLPSVQKLLDDIEIQRLTSIDNDSSLGVNHVIKSYLDTNYGKEIPISEAVDKLLKCIQICKMVPSLGKYNIPLSKEYDDYSREEFIELTELMTSLSQLSLPEISTMIEEAGYEGNDYQLIEKAQKARYNLLALYEYADCWAGCEATDICREYLALTLKGAIAEEYRCSIDNVNFIVTETSQVNSKGESVTKKQLVIAVYNDDCHDRFSICDENNLLYQVALAFDELSEKEGQKAPYLCYPNDLEKIVKYIELGNLMLASGSNKTNDTLNVQNDKPYAEQLIKIGK